MLSLEQLNALRGTKVNASAPAASTDNEQNESQNVSQPETVAMPNSAAQTQEQPQQENSYIAPVEVPCKNYDDEEGHFAYIDANTHQATHVNLITGQPYTQDDVNRLSFLKVANSLFPEAKNLAWQQVINNNTLYDQFGYPMFTVEEVQNALYKVQATDNHNSEENKPKTDPFGFPL